MCLGEVLDFLDAIAGSELTEYQVHVVAVGGGGAADWGAWGGGSQNQYHIPTLDRPAAVVPASNFVHLSPL